MGDFKRGMEAVLGALGLPGEGHESPAMPDQYQHRVLSYFDVLGWKDVVEQSVEEPILISHLMAALSAPSALEFSIMNSDVELTQFSDHVCISVAAGGEDSVQLIAMFTTEVVVRMMEFGFGVRGALVQGRLIHDSHRIFGPALVEAHYIESRVAKYPRIVLSEPVARQFEEDSAGKLKKHSPRLKDVDGLSYLDVLAHVPRKLFQGMRRALQYRMSKPDLDVKAKLGWLMNYLDAKERDNPDRPP